MAEDPELKKIIPRINELAHKAKLQDLTDKEKEERDQLRKHYLKRFKSNFKSQIEMTQIYDKDGKEVTPEEVKEIQRKKNLRDN
ncbi:DUF896 domain-containing protein [Fructilactobacillus sanfranciscensis]|uniref:UPF0291 protein LSA_08370 n=2 Tax=Fructilactobacillus sanfranciscensis TaxID=1625 RepID=G2KVJ9_FRUST|nr:DUF896 domain-containing protein [Fructilactobacillus sanfranciscensis]AEN99243.1 UPF0291 protein [Fructilactobacillus sanfranciscensis TMW 1.1304]KRM80673.1 hypothetical protein FD36_GL001093 [Fructilactobacillus sanfranciscensis DSM 20451]MCG7194510.1 DUF896 domain-containing protein [Fructilactobacillus sanfranciscensis]MCG7195182.1 DUF896 domain-containing protein [Fructilactobacillus sanfranciscensis]MDN4461762.1 DUF896 domain-containing protein [Fructilactobacillus sanfranciscensis]